VTAPGVSAVKAGDTIEPLSRTVTQEQINAYADASGDHNPIHLDADFATAVGLPGTIAHGMLTLGILTQALGRWAGGTDRVASLEVRFSKPLRAGDTVTCTGSVVAVDEEAGLATLEVDATSSSGERVMTNGRATVRLSQQG